jgi:hypothetical protein
VPCYRCGARQTDPVRGDSPWLRGVLADEQVLVCPDCQSSTTWADELDRCDVCGSTRLIRRLGRTVCRDCETAAPPVTGTDAGHVDFDPSDRDLAKEVAAAIERVLGRAGR